MNLDNSTANAEGSTEPVKKTRRRVVRSAGTPAPVQSETATSAAAPAAAAAEATTAPQTKAPRTRKARPVTESSADQVTVAEAPSAKRSCATA